VDRLHELETEISIEAAGMRLPPDPELTELLARILTTNHPYADLQIVVNSSRKTTTTKQFYETETPGMVGLLPEQLHDLQQKLMQKISSVSFDPAASTVPKGEDNHPTRADKDADVQQRESVEEGSNNADGTQVDLKKTARVVSTSQSGVSGFDEHGRPIKLEVADDRIINGGGSLVTAQTQQFQQQEGISANSGRAVPILIQRTD